MNLLAMDTERIALLHFQMKIKEEVQTPIKFTVEFATHAIKRGIFYMNPIYNKFRNRFISRVR